MILILLLIILLLVVLYFWIHMIRDANKLNVQGPFPLPIVGNGHLFIGDSTKLLTVLGQLAKEYNDVFRMYILSHRYVCLSHPKYIEPFLTSTEIITKGRAYDLTRPWLGNGLLTSTGFVWKTQRKLLNPVFHLNALQSFLPIFLKNSKILKSKLMSLADGTPIKLSGIIGALSFDNITESVMGTSFNTQKLTKSEYLTAIEDISHVISSRVGNPLLANDFLFNLSYKKLKMDKALSVLHKYADEVIQSRRKVLREDNIHDLQTNEYIGVKGKQSFLDSLLLADVGGINLDDEAIFSQVNTFMFAGHDTVATAMVFALYCISNNKEVQDKIFEEQKTIFNGNMERDPTYNELQQMKYLELVIKESVRLYQPVPVIERLITEDTNLAGIYLPKGTFLFINLFEMHRNSKVYENPLEFKPDRFENNIKHFDWLPFSTGPRNCIGQKFSMLEMKATLSSIVKHFELLPSGKVPVLIDEIVLKSKNSVYVSFIPRSQ